MEIKVEPITDFEDEKARHYMKGVRYTVQRPLYPEIFKDNDGCVVGRAYSEKNLQDSVDGVPIALIFKLLLTPERTLHTIDIWYPSEHNDFDRTVNAYVLKEMKYWTKNHRGAPFR